MPPPPLRALALIEEDCRLIAIYPLIGAMPARAGREINRIEIRTQMMAGNAGGGFYLQYIIAWQALRALHPFPNSGGGYFANACQLGLRPEGIDRLQKGFIDGGRFNHG
jgi:hypothetical protein